MNYRAIIDKLDTDEWAIPEKFLSEHEEFLQALVDKVEEQCNIDLVVCSCCKSNKATICDKCNSDMCVSASGHN